MKKTSFVPAALLSVAMLLGFTSFASANSTYIIDTAGVHYYAGFQISHLGFSTMHGRFDALSGTIKYDDAEPTNSQVSITIKASSINTNMAKRDAHLKSPDFFNVEEFSDITFVSTKLVKTGEKTAKFKKSLEFQGDCKILFLYIRSYTRRTLNLIYSNQVTFPSDFAISYQFLRRISTPVKTRDIATKKRSLH